MVIYSTRDFTISSFVLNLNISASQIAGLTTACVIKTQIAKFMGTAWGPPGSCRPQMGPMLVPWTLLSGEIFAILQHGIQSHYSTASQQSVQRLQMYTYQVILNMFRNPTDFQWGFWTSPGKPWWVWKCRTYILPLIPKMAFHFLHFCTSLGCPL